MKIRRERTLVRRRRIALGTAAATLVAPVVPGSASWAVAPTSRRPLRATPRRVPRGRPGSRRPPAAARAPPRRPVLPPRRRRVPPPTRRRWCVVGGSPATSRRSRSSRPGAASSFAQNMMYTHSITVYAARRAPRTIPDTVDLRRSASAAIPASRSGAPVEAAFTLTAPRPTSPTTRCTARVRARGLDSAPVGRLRTELRIPRRHRDHEIDQVIRWARSPSTSRPPPTAGT